MRQQIRRIISRMQRYDKKAIRIKKGDLRFNANPLITNRLLVMNLDYRPV